MRWWRHRAATDAVWLLGVALASTALAVRFDAFDHFAAFIAEHEDWELDELFTGLFCTGCCGFVYAIRRVTDMVRECRARERAQEDALWLSLHDPLTRLPNRAGLEEHLKLPSPIVGGVMHIDLDGFRAVNDLHGSAAGDALLTEAAQRLREIFPNAWIGRPGGDEFVILLQDISLPVLQQQAGRVIRNLSRPVRLQGRRVEVGASIGIAAVPQHGATLREALQCAEAALLAARQEERNGLCVYQTEMREKQTARARLEQSLREAVQAEVIRPHYQPQIDLETGHVIGFEALARWWQEDGTRVSPEVFIIAAERTGLIHRLTDQLLQRACRDAMRWPPTVRLAFNLSAMQLGDPRLAQRVFRAIEAAGLPPERLEVEITESALVREADVAQATITALRERGIRVALDDFGTGYASLSQLVMFSFDVIKIDRSFIRNCLEDDRQMKIVKSILGLGQGLGIEITAEGVEKTGQADLLRSLGCHIGQGYLFGAAMPAEETERLFGQDGQKAAVA